MELNSIKLDLMWFLKYVLLQNKEDGMSGWLVSVQCIPNWIWLFEVMIIK